MNPYNNVCDQCYRRKLCCSRERPSCKRCQQSGQQCTYSVVRPVGRPRRLESGESRQRRRSIIRNSIRRREQSQRNDLYSPGSQPNLEDHGDSPSSPQPAQKDDTRRRNTETQIHDDSSNSETTMLFPPDLVIALSPLRHEVQTDHTYQNHSTRSAQDFARSQAEHHGQLIGQPNDAQGISEPMITTRLDCNLLTPMSSTLDGEFLDLDFPNQERLYMDPEPEQFSTGSESEGESKCNCHLSIVHFLNTSGQRMRTKRDSIRNIQILNEVAEQFLLCDSSHSRLWYTVLVALYQDAQDGLSSKEELQAVVDARSHTKGSHGGMKLNSDSTNSNMRNVLLKTFVLLSSAVSVLPFKFGAEGDNMLDAEITEALAESVRDRFENRLMEQMETKRCR